MVLPYINMNPPRVYTCSPSRTPLSPPSPYHPSGSSQCTSPKHPVLCIEPGLATRFIYDTENNVFKVRLLLCGFSSLPESVFAWQAMLCSRLWSLLLSVLQDFFWDELLELTLLSFFEKDIYLTAAGLSCYMWDLVT